MTTAEDWVKIRLGKIADRQLSHLPSKDFYAMIQSDALREAAEIASDGGYRVIRDAILARAKEVEKP